MWLCSARGAIPKHPNPARRCVPLGYHRFYRIAFQRVPFKDSTTYIPISLLFGGSLCMFLILKISLHFLLIHPSEEGGQRQGSSQFLGLNFRTLVKSIFITDLYGLGESTFGTLCGRADQRSHERFTRPSNSCNAFASSQ